MHAPGSQVIIMPKVEKSFSVSREDGAYIVHAPKVERLVPLADLRDWQAMIQLWGELKRLGVVKALEEQGVQPGDTVALGRRGPGVVLRCG